MRLHTSKPKSGKNKKSPKKDEFWHHGSRNCRKNKERTTPTTDWNATDTRTTHTLIHRSQMSQMRILSRKWKNVGEKLDTVGVERERKFGGVNNNTQFHNINSARAKTTFPHWGYDGGGGTMIINRSLTSQTTMNIHRVQTYLINVNPTQPCQTTINIHPNAVFTLVTQSIAHKYAHTTSAWRITVDFRRPTVQSTVTPIRRPHLDVCRWLKTVFVLAIQTPSVVGSPL